MSLLYSLLEHPSSPNLIGVPLLFRFYRRPCGDHLSFLGDRKLAQTTEKSHKWDILCLLSFHASRSVLLGCCLHYSSVAQGAFLPTMLFGYQCEANRAVMWMGLGGWRRHRVSCDVYVADTLGTDALVSCS